MKVESVSLERFSVFERAHIDFSTGLNVFIGANGTGKSHLMKLLYSVLKTQETARKDGIDDKQRIAARLKEKLAGVFQPDGKEPHRLIRRQVGQASTTVALEASGGEFSFKLTRSGNLTVESDSLEGVKPSLFIPSREAIAMYHGFIDAYDKRELSFDETYYDLCKALSGRPAKGPRLKKAAELVKPLEEILGGKVSIEGGRFQVYSSDGVLEAHLLAEGFRKIAGLVHLINNGSLMANGTLFWDEPEANLNPRLITRIAKTLRILADRGVQVFVATHDYLLSHELSLAVEYQTKPKVPTRFFAFQRDDSGPVSVQAGDTLADLEHNPILEEFAAHYDRERELFSERGRVRGKGA